MATPLYEYVGNVHIHSRFSDGSGDVPLIARAARRARLDFIIITDHRTMAAQAFQGWQDRLLVLVGLEMGLRQGHYLGLGLKECPEETAPQAMIDAVRAAGGVGFIAHPDDRRFGWPDWQCSGFDGISLWNYCSQWRGALRGQCRCLYYLFFPGKAVTVPPEATRRRWDALNRAGRLYPVLGSSDAHASGFRPLGLPLVVLPYGKVFRAINMHVLLDRPLAGVFEPDEAAVFGALGRGSAFIADERLGVARGFRFWAENNAGAWGMGETAPGGSGLSLRVSVPKPAELVLLRDGQVARTAHGNHLTLEHPAAGVYRVEVFRDRGRRRGWIYSNPIGVQG